MATTNDDERRRALAAPLTVDEFFPLSSTVKVDIGARSHPGLVRPTNDDHYLVVRLGRNQETIATSLSEADLPPRFHEQGFAMLVADGIASDGSASVASRVALSTIAHLALQHGKWNLRVSPAIASEVLARVAWLYAQADEAVVKQREHVPALVDMAAALTAALSAGDHLFIAHVGHSRAYLFRNGALTQLTRDDTTAQHLADTGRPIAIERRGRDQGHILTDAIGARGSQPAAQVEHFRLVDGDGVLLCTNGLTDMLSDDVIAETLAHRRQSNEQCRILLDHANQKGGADNITVILAQYEVPALP